MMVLRMPWHGGPKYDVALLDLDPRQLNGRCLDLRPPTHHRHGHSLDSSIRGLTQNNN